MKFSKVSTSNSEEEHEFSEREGTVNFKKKIHQQIPIKLKTCHYGLVSVKKNILEGLKIINLFSQFNKLLIVML